MFDTLKMSKSFSDDETAHTLVRHILTLTAFPSENPDDENTAVSPILSDVLMVREWEKDPPEGGSFCLIAPDSHVSAWDFFC